MSARLLTAAAATALVLAAACTRNEQTAAQAPAPAAPAPVPQPASVADVKLGTSPSPEAAITEAKQDFAPGEPIQLSMDVLGATAGTAVTTYWYGPDNQRLAYETQTVTPTQQRLRFRQDNTVDWQAGQYRAEVWIGDDKVQEQSFEIGAG